MQKKNLLALIEEVRRQRTEKQTLELKTAHGGFPGKIYDTLSSFSNQDDGGILLFGISDKPEYEVVGVYDVEDAQKKIMEACSQMEPKVRIRRRIHRLYTYGNLDTVHYHLRARGLLRVRDSFV